MGGGGGLEVIGSRGRGLPEGSQWPDQHTGDLAIVEQVWGW